MRKWLAVVYTALALGANPAAAGDDLAARLAPLMTGDMAKLVLSATPKPLPDPVLLDGSDAPHHLSDYRGRWVVLNFWATWCAPCRKEMPSLQRMQGAMPDLAVLPVAAGRNPPEGIARFYADAGVTTLPILRDPKSELSRPMGVLGLPLTVIVNPDGAEVARLIGDAEWDGPAARAVLGALITP